MFKMKMVFDNEDVLFLTAEYVEIERAKRRVVCLVDGESVSYDRVNWVEVDGKYAACMEKEEVEDDEQSNQTQHHTNCDKHVR